MTTATDVESDVTYNMGTVAFVTAGHERNSEYKTGRLTDLHVRAHRVR